MMYDIGIDEIYCIKKKYDEQGVSIRYEATAATRPSSCPFCASRKLHHHSASYNLIKDTKSEGKLVFIYLKIQIYRCPSCRKTCTDRFTFYDKHAHMTQRLRDEFVRRCVEGDSFTNIAKDYMVDPKTVSASFKRYVAEHHELFENAYTPEALGIDEVHIDGKMRLVLTDILGQKMLDMRKDNKANTVKAYLRTLGPEICECATMDFAPGYASAVSAILPNTAIIVDRFHIVQELNRCVDRIRIQTQNQYKGNKKILRSFKKSRLLFMTNFEDLSQEAYDRIEEFGESYPELYKAYFVKETFRDIYVIADGKQTASELFDVWLTNVPEWEEFHGMKNTFTKRREHILNYWDYNLTNAYTESVNNRIKAINKTGRGYSFDILRKRCLIAVNTEEKKPFNPRTAVYKECQETGQRKEGQVKSEPQYTLAIEQYKNAMSNNTDIMFAKRMAQYAYSLLKPMEKAGD